jgi:rhodanese-related sulfurtransferase
MIAASQSRFDIKAEVRKHPGGIKCFVESSNHRQVAMQSITPQSLSELSAKSKLKLIDVRTPVEFQEIHVPFATNIPLDRLDTKAIERLKQESNSIYVICRSGSRGSKACEKFVAAGIDDAVNIEGGTIAWEQAGLPVVRGKKSMSLERQVRIAAGLLVFLGSTLGYFVHPYFIGLAAFVGAGLVFAGVTDTCAMGMLIAKMPWNRVESSTKE